MKHRTKSPVTVDPKYLSQLSINGLNGRLMHLPSKKKKKIVFLSGHHTAHERTFAIAELLNEYGEVYAPDTPGFGGMNSFYSIGMDVSYDTYADYLYTFMKSQQLTKDITLFATSFGSQVTTRMLQKYPESQKWVRQNIGFVAFGGGQDFSMGRIYKLSIYCIVYPASTRFGAWVLQSIFENKIVMSLIMAVFSRAKAKMHSNKDNTRQDMIDMEKYLWESGDARTHAKTTLMMFKDDLRKYSNQKIPLTMTNITTEDDQYLDTKQVANTFRDLYRSYDEHTFNSNVHMPSMISSKEEIRKMMPDDIDKVLSK